MKSKTTVAYIIDNDGTINLFKDSSNHVINSSHINYSKIVECLKEENYEKLDELVNVPKMVSDKTSGKIQIKNGSIYYGGKELINPLSDRITKLIEQELPFKPMVKFLENLMENESIESIKELYLFMQKNNLPITEDGHLIAYRKVDNDYMSYHPNPDGTKNRNMIGDVVEKKRNEVDSDRHSTCSRGLHFCSIDYLPHYEGGLGKVMIIKINPKNVVSIPVDYNNAKGRCCKYEVVGEYIGSNKEQKDYTEAPIVATNGQEKNFHNKRDSKGRFIKKDAVVVSDTVKFHNVRDGNGRFVKKSTDLSACNGYHNKRDGKGRFTKS
jgi:hypothetical protein